MYLVETDIRDINKRHIETNLEIVNSKSEEAIKNHVQQLRSNFRRAGLLPYYRAWKIGEEVKF